MLQHPVAITDVKPPEASNGMNFQRSNDEGFGYFYSLFNACLCVNTFLSELIRLPDIAEHSLAST